jgi:hypothetical protein
MASALSVCVCMFVCAWTDEWADGQTYAALFSCTFTSVHQLYHMYKYISVVGGSDNILFTKWSQLIGHPCMPDGVPEITVVWNRFAPLMRSRAYCAVFD